MQIEFRQIREEVDPVRQGDQLVVIEPNTLQLHASAIMVWWTSWRPGEVLFRFYDIILGHAPRLIQSWLCANIEIRSNCPGDGFAIYRFYTLPVLAPHAMLPGLPQSQIPIIVILSFMDATFSRYDVASCLNHTWPSTSRLMLQEYYNARHVSYNLIQSREIPSYTKSNKNEKVNPPAESLRHQLQLIVGEMEDGELHELAQTRRNTWQITDSDVFYDQGLTAPSWFQWNFSQTVVTISAKMGYYQCQFNRIQFLSIVISERWSAE